MPETITAPPPIQMDIPDMESPEQLYSPDIEAERIVESVFDLGVEVEDKKKVKESLTILIDEFEIDNDALSGTKNELVMTAIASRMSKLEDIKDVGRHGQEKEYIADLVMLSVGENTQFSDLLESSFNEVSDNEIKMALDKFTQPEVTKDMDKYIRGAEFDELRKKLGITSEDDMEVRVLSIVDDQKTQLYGLRRRSTVYDAEETSYITDYESGLVKNGRDFAESTGRKELFAPAWVDTLENGTTYLCLSLPTAEKVLYQEEDRADYYGNQELGGDIAMVMHEYTHTRNRLSLSDTHTGLGTALEELRAEHFSGNKHGYTDIKKFFQGMKMLTGYSPESSFDMKDGYDESKFLLDIVDHVGLDGLLDAFTVMPKNYAEDDQASGIMRSVVGHDSGVSGSFENLYSDMVNRFGEEVVQQNIDDYVDALRNRIIDMKSEDENSSITVEDASVYGGVESYAKTIIDNFRNRYPDESNGYEYFEA